MTTTPSGKPCWSRDAAIGDYGGASDKRHSTTEGDVPYAFLWYREIQALRGSAYTIEPSTLVHCENLALARLLAYWASRYPECIRANSLPASAGELVEYWAAVLGIPARPGEQRWSVRERTAAHFRAVRGITLATIEDDLTELLGDAFVDASFSEGADLETPPAITYWPGVNDGPAAYDLGGGAWITERSHLYVEVQQPAGMSIGEFRQLVDVDLFQYLDRTLPAWCTFGWALGSGFLLDVSQLDYVGLLP